MNADFLLNRIETIAREWEQELILTGKPVTADQGYDDKRKWGLPPLSCASKGSVDVNAMLRDYYHLQVKVADVLEAWGGFEAAVAPGTTGSRQVLIRQAFQRVFPNFRFGTDMNHPTYQAAQFLKLVSFDGHPIKVTAGHCLLNLNGRTIGIDRRAIHGVTSSYRTRMAWDDFRLALSHFSPLRGSQAHYPQTNPTCLLLTQGLPRRRHEILVVFSLAIHLGPEFEKKLLEPFYVSMDKFEAIPIDDPFVVARTIVLTSEKNPIRQLSGLLIPRVGSKTFTKHFGTNYSRATKSFTAVTQARYLAALDSLAQQERKGPTKSSKDNLLSHFFGL